jgi:hypothetical protein
MSNSTLKRFSTKLHAAGGRWALWRCWNAYSRVLVHSGCVVKSYTWNGWFDYASLEFTIEGTDDQLRMASAVLSGWSGAKNDQYNDAPTITPVAGSGEPVPVVTRITYDGSLKAWNGSFALSRAWICMGKILLNSGCVLKKFSHEGWDDTATITYTIEGTPEQIEIAKAIAEGWRTV